MVVITIMCFFFLLLNFGFITAKIFLRGKEEYLGGSTSTLIIIVDVVALQNVKFDVSFGQNVPLGWSARIMLKFNHVTLSTAYSNILVNQFLLGWPISVLFDQKNVTGLMASLMLMVSYTW